MNLSEQTAAQLKAALEQASVQLRDVTMHSMALQAMLMNLAHAVIRSHPNPVLFREEWDQSISTMWSMSAGMSATGNPALPEIRRIQEQIESGFPPR
jgi:hypothetical protein